MRTDIDLQRMQARSGDRDALNVLGRRLLLGEGIEQAFSEGVRLTLQAAQLGQPEALTRRALFAAWGIQQRRDMGMALDDLEQAARSGWAPAQQQLALLARREANDWQALRSEIDLQSLVASRPPTVLRQQPQVAAIECFASPAECRWLIERGRPSLHRALVYRGSATPRSAETRTNSETGFTIGNADVFLSVLRDRMAAAAGTAITHFEVTKLLHYRVGEQFALHGDFLGLNTPELRQEIELRGQRSMTLLVYLNDDYEGGATEFPRLGLRWRAKCGDALLFSNINASGAPDYDSVHAGLPVTRGEKWLLSQWIRTRPVG